MSLKMKELPENERPYEKLKIYGSERLSNAELLSIIIKSGTKDENSINIADRILLLTNNLKDIKYISINDLTQIKGVGEIKAIQIKAMYELANRMSNNSKLINIKIKDSKDVSKLLMDEMKNKTQEVLKAIILNSKNIILKIVDIAIGDTNFVNISLKQIIAENIRMQAPKLIIVHNHPSGDPMPSQSDYLLTKKLKEACNLLGILLLDHIVIGYNKYESIMSTIDKNVK